MSKFFYTKLAAGNLVKNRKLYLPYNLMNICIIIMFYIMHSIATNDGVAKLPYSATASTMLFLGTIIVGIFAVILVFYTNSFLIKQRQKEIGLFNILGMEKKHIAKMLGLESLLCALFCLSVGLISGMVLSKLMFMGYLKLLKVTVPIAFGISLQSIYLSLVFFGILFFLTLVFNVTKMHLINPIDLLKGGNVGEKEPKTKWLMALIGFGCLGYGYYLAQSVDNPLSAIGTFFIAVILVIVATYSIFTAGSIVILKLLRKNKKFYYKPKHFIAVSGMLYRMKQNASGLASICILSCAVLVSVSTTVSLYIGMDDLMSTTYPKNITITTYGDGEAASLDEFIGEIDQLAKREGITIQEPVRYSETVEMVNAKSNHWTKADSQNYDYREWSSLVLLTADEMSQLEGREIKVPSNTLALYTNPNELLKESVQIGDVAFAIESRVDESLKVKQMYVQDLEQGIIAVVNSDLEREIIAKNLSDAEFMVKNIYGFDLEGTADENKAFANQVEALRKSNVEGVLRSRDLAMDEFVGIYGGFLFIGIFLGSLFLMATAMIIYYKQMSEGYDDQGRYEILQKVGMSHGEIKKTISRQIVMVFFLPLVTAIIHIAFAFNVIKHLLTVFGLVNTQLFITCTLGTIGAFALIYFIVYLLTAKAYYKLLVN